ncbi:MAG: Ldh family oxidoreductase [Spirochaetaceae bacterium]|nr:MAG: Ldh family oxidoreductase [Spirochaetaceae bacterium]
MANSYENCVWVDFDLLERFMTDVFVKVGIPEADAAICANVLITSDKRGIDSHGVGRFKPIYIDRIEAGIINPKTVIDILREGPTTAVLDGNNGMGQVVAKKAMQMAIDKAKHYGMGMVVVRNSNHYGIAGYWSLMAIKENMIGITGTNARPSVAPTFGVENLLGTNPLTIGFPTDEEFPFLIDCASSIIQRGKVEVCARLGEEIPMGLVIDKNGESKTDSRQVLADLIAGDAALLPLGGMGEETAGYKGYGYSTVVEILSAALQQGAFLTALSGFADGKKVPHKLGHFFIAIDVTAFTEPDAFKKIAGDILRTLRNSRKMPGHDRIWTAGEKEHDAWLARQGKGVPVDAEVQKEFIGLKKKFGLDLYRFPFEKQV